MKSFDLFRKDVHDLDNWRLRINGTICLRGIWACPRGCVLSKRWGRKSRGKWLTQANPGLPGK